MRTTTTTRPRHHPHRYPLAVCLTSIVMTLQPVQSVTVNRVAALSTADAASAGYEVTGRLCLIPDRCGRFTITVRSAPDRSPPAPSR